MKSARKGVKTVKKRLQTFQFGHFKIVLCHFFLKVKIVFPMGFSLWIVMKSQLFLQASQFTKKWSKRRISALNEFTKHFRRLGYCFKKMCITMSKIHLQVPPTECLDPLTCHCKSPCYRKFYKRLKVMPIMKKLKVAVFFWNLEKKNFSA